MTGRSEPPEVSTTSLQAVLPQGLIRSQTTFGTNAWTWPATNSDGQSTDPINSVAMGSRLRLKATECGVVDDVRRQTAGGDHPLEPCAITAR